MPVRHPRVPASEVAAQPSIEAAETFAASNLSDGRPSGSGGASSSASFSVRDGFGSFASSAALPSAAHSAEAAAAQAQHAAAASGHTYVPSWLS